MKNNKKKYIFVILLCLAIVIFFSSGLELQKPVEELDIAAGIGYDIEKKGTAVNYVVSSSVYLFEPQEKIESALRTGTGLNIGATRQDRQLSGDKQNILGFEKVFIISEEQAAYGIRNIADVLFRNSNLNDTGMVAVCKGKASDMLALKVKGYPSSSDFIEGLIKNSVYYNFSPDEYRVMCLFMTIDEEGDNLTLPYIEITDKGIQITGLCLFNKDKMVAKINVDELRIMNILRENNVKGVLSMQKTPKEYINFYTTSKRKVSCTKEGDKYKFTINIDLKGELITDTLYKGLQKDSKKNAEFSKEMSKEVKKKCNDFIIKMKNEYKVDCLQLGKVAAAKCGRHTGVDWNSIVSNSEIEINVKVNVEKNGRGDY